MDLIHTAIKVSELEVSKEFYVDALGLTVELENETEDQRNSFVMAENDAGLQLIEPKPPGPPPDPSGIDHIAVTVNDVEEAFDRLTETNGYPVVAEPETISETARFAYVEDPDSYHVELVEYLD